MRINPIAHGHNNNLYCSAKKYGYKFKMVCFFSTGSAFIIKAWKTGHKTPEPDFDAVYDDLKQSLHYDMDFELKTPREGFHRIRMKESEQEQLKKEQNV